MYHFFIDESQREQEIISIEGSDVKHIRNVLRMKVGEEIKISDGDNIEYYCRIEGITDKQVKARILEIKESFAELPAEIILFQGLPKSDKMEWVIQKAVELGAAKIAPMTTNRSVVKLDAKKEEAKHKRWTAIAESAAKQSGRTKIPEILPVMSFQRAIDFTKDFKYRLIPYELADNMSQTRAIIEQLTAGSRIAVYIGPEGGFDKAEVEYAVSSGVIPISLGKRILRTETAGLAILSILMYQLEENENR